MDVKGYNNVVLADINGVLENRGVNARQTLYYCDRVQAYAETINDEKLLGFSFYYRGETFYILNDVDQLFQNVSRALAYLDRSKQWDLLARGYNLLGITSISRGNAPFAMDYYLNALSYCNQYHMDELSLIVNMNIGTLYNGIGDYRQAQHYFEISYGLVSSVRLEEEYRSYLLNIYIGIGNTYLYQEQPQKALIYEEKVQNECMEQADLLEQLVFYSFQARLNNSLGNTAKRDVFVQKIDEMINKKISILAVYDDLFLYAQFLFNIGKYKEFWNVVDVTEALVRQAGIVYMQKKLFSLKIKYYKLKEDQEAYREACGVYYELSDAMEEENRYMVTNMIQIRSFLEESKKLQRKVEAENKVLQKRSETDALTGLYNRYRLNEFAEDAFADAIEKHSQLAVEILDIDYFKQYNDNYGHQAGDQCIIKIAKCIQRMAEGKNIFCARYGGDEFILIYEGYEKEEVAGFTQKLKADIMNLNLEHQYSKLMPLVTISQGVCYDIPQEGNKIWDFLHTADSMLYHVKEVQRNNVEIGYFDKNNNFSR